ncbi:hypothetical protein DFP73DRAFT_552098 [Morchella snyderi]|nr:hypothetical protein DFP73DRAFT_552098 [Morchella snyderi]
MSCILPDSSFYSSLTNTYSTCLAAAAAGMAQVGLTKGKSAVPKEDGPTETTDQASVGAPEEVGDDIRDTLGESSTQQDVRDSENSEEPSQKAYDGDNWGPEIPSKGIPKVLKRGRGRQENHGLPPLQIAGMVTPSRDKIIRDREALNTQGELHTDISERIHRGGRGGGGGHNSGLTLKISTYSFENESTDHLEGAWRKRPDVPTTEELLREVIDLPTNSIDGAFDSVDDYLETHYELLREDAFACLRDAVLLMKEDPSTDDTHDVSIYENVRVLGLTFSKTGIATKVSFCTNRSKKKIPWMNSKRLLPGTLVCLSHDNFKTIKMATVVARPLSGVEMNPPEVDLLFNETELEIDTEKVFLMVESRNGYFEAYKWTLRALQRMTEKNFPLHEHICFLNKNVPPPRYVMQKPHLNVSPIFPDIPDKEPFEDVDIIKAWHQLPSNGMDSTQMKALHSILTRRVSIVQGPPGTGKTHVSVQALRLLLHNMDAGDPPIIVACQTNHALDQLLNHILEFEEEVVRMGGRTQDKDKIKDHTMFELRMKSNVKIQGSQHGYALANIKKIRDKMMELFECLKQEVLTVDDLYDSRLITPAQAKSFNERSAGWILPEETNAKGGIIGQWLGEHFNEIKAQETIGGEFEEADIEEEKRKEVEVEFGRPDDGRLKGDWFTMYRQYTVDKPSGVTMADIQLAKRVQNVWDIEGYMRAALYHHLRTQFITKIWNKVVNLNKDYQHYCQLLKISKMETDAHIISKNKIIGMTTTGLAKNRSIIAAVGPKIVLIEEAAEALEGPVVVACMPSVEHLILVGDHKQLRGHCSDINLSDDPYYLDISMFERLVTNELPYETLRTQRRMRPTIRELLKPIYADTLVDDNSVRDRPSVQGMGDMNVYWYTHFDKESVDEVHSRVNAGEAGMIVKFTEYLALNELSPDHITILTFYAGQKTRITQELRANGNLAGADIKVKTVDSYQGEQNEVIILSLVRSNEHGQIGFLDVENRVCVALSRAKKGLYIFGNAQLITQVSKLWYNVGTILNATPSRMGAFLPLMCHSHKVTTKIANLNDWDGINGGCRKPCLKQLPCGHNCDMKCHSFSHDNIRCQSICGRTLPCNHQCDNICGKECSCPKCGKVSGKPRPPPPGSSGNPVTAPNQQPPTLPVIAIENRATERPLIHAASNDRPQVTPNRLVDFDDDWQSALPTNRAQTAENENDFPGIPNRPVPFAHLKAILSRIAPPPPQSRSLPPQSRPLPPQSRPLPPQSRPLPPQSRPLPPQSRPLPPSSLQPPQHRPQPSQDRPPPQNRPRENYQQESYQQDSYQDGYLQDVYQRENPSLDNRLAVHPRNNHPPNYPPNNFPRGQVDYQDDIINNQGNYGEIDYNRGNVYPSRGGPGMAIRGAAYDSGRRQVRETWVEDGRNSHFVDREGGMPREAYGHWETSREYPTQERRAPEEWPSLRGANSPRGIEPVHRGNYNNVWNRNNPNHEPRVGGGGRGGHASYTTYR